METWSVEFYQERLWMLKGEDKDPVGSVWFALLQFYQTVHILAGWLLTALAAAGFSGLVRLAHRE